eukprot:scaffold2742_cov167-Amphora_coffeaeformis.AAC.5
MTPGPVSGGHHKTSRRLPPCGENKRIIVVIMRLASCSDIRSLVMYNNTSVSAWYSTQQC